MTDTQTSSGAPSKSKKAFDAPHTSTFMFDPDDLVIVGVDTKDTEAHALYDRRAMKPISDEFVDNLIHVGILQNVVVVKRNDKAYVVAGRRRTLGARLANQIIAKQGGTEAFEAKYNGPRKPIRIPVKVMPSHLSDAELALIAGTENTRVEENILDKAERVQKVLKLLPDKMPEPDKYRQIALAYSVTETAVRQWLKVAEAIAPIRRAVADGIISPTAAIKIAVGTDEEQRANLDELLSGATKPTAAKAEKVAGKKKAKKKASGDDDLDAPKGDTRSKRALKKALKAVDDNRLRMSSEAKEVADMVLRWAMGDDLTEAPWDTCQDDKVLRTITGRE